MIRLALSIAATTAAVAAPLVPSGPPHRLHRPPPALSNSLTVDEQEWSIIPSHKVVAAGNVKFQVYNRGMDEHNLTIKSAGRINGAVWVQSGQSSTLDVNLRPGTYLLYCSMFAGTPQSHEMLGMHTVLTVR
jgi:plastocyanin